MKPTSEDLVAGPVHPFYITDPVFLLACIGITIWAGIVNRRTPILDWKFWTTIGCTLFFYAFSFANDIVTIVLNEVVVSYVMVKLLFGSVGYPAAILLLATILALLFRLLQHRTANLETLGRFDTKMLGSNRGLLANYVFCGFLGLLYIIRMALHIAYITEVVLQSSRVDHSIPVAQIIDLSFSILYFLASIEVLALSIILMKSHTTGHGSPGRYVSSPPSHFFVFDATRD